MVVVVVPKCRTREAFHDHAKRYSLHANSGIIVVL
jgi:hypothetical protein